MSECSAKIGFDSGQSAIALAEGLNFQAGADGGGRWVRIRDLPQVQDRTAVPATLQALHRLHSGHFRVCVLLMASSTDWAHGTRGHASRLPIDLRDGYDRAFHLAKTYGGLIDAWEIENEPDIGFVAENGANYAAFLKASYLGLKDGFAAAPRELHQRIEAGAIPCIVLMGALALPPGPYWQTLAANQVLSYTDGLNYHYYGYAEDFTSVHAQFQAAVAQAGTQPFRPHWRPLNSETKDLPVFLSEFGYGSLSRMASSSSAGRIRQWQWFRSVGIQIESLGIVDAMAFHLLPYLENGMQEFGLTVPLDAEFNFTAADFGLKARAQWMDRIGTQLVANRSTPALAWLLSSPDPSRGQSLIRITTPRPSSVVLDLIPGREALEIKQCQGLALPRHGPNISASPATLMVYNFGKTEKTGSLVFSPAITLSNLQDAKLTLQPGQVRPIPVELCSASDRLQSERAWFSFQPDDLEISISRFEINVFPDSRGMTKHIVTSLENAVPREQSDQNRRILKARVYAKEEPPEVPHGSWLCTPGVEVTDTADGWIFIVNEYSPEPLRPAIAELVLPDSFYFEAGSLLELEYRLLSVPGQRSRLVAEPRSPLPSSAQGNEALGIYLRTATGNLYTVWQSTIATEQWQRSAQFEESFTMAGYGRAGMPWQFSEHRPVALVFTFKPNHLPVRFAIRKAAIVNYKLP